MLTARAIIKGTGARKCGSEHRMRGICHNGGKDSDALCIKESNGKLLLYCHARCSFVQIIAALRSHYPALFTGQDGEEPHRQEDPVTDPDSVAQKIERAHRLYRRAVPLRGTLSEHYLAARGISLEDLPDRCPLRHVPNAFHGKAERKLPCLIAPIVNVVTNAFQGVSKTYLDPSGGKAKVEPARLFSGRKSGGCVKLTPDEDVTHGLAIAEGIETALSAPFRPIWACLDAGNLAEFPALGGIEALTVFADNDEAGTEAARVVGERWRMPGREVRLLRPRAPGQDFNDLARGIA